MEIANVGIGGVLALLVLREVFSFVKQQRSPQPDNSSVEKTLALMEERLATGHQYFQTLLENEQSERVTAQAQATVLLQVAEGLKTVLTNQTTVALELARERGRQEGEAARRGSA